MQAKTIIYISIKYDFYLNCEILKFYKIIKENFSLIELTAQVIFFEEMKMTLLPNAVNSVKKWLAGDKFNE